MTTEGKNKMSKWVIGVICSLSGLLLGTAFGGGIYAERINTNNNDIRELKQTDKELQNLIIETGKDIRQEIKDFRKELKNIKE